MAAISRLVCDSSGTALIEAPQSIEGADVDAAGQSQDGRRFVPPGKRPSTVSQQGRGVSDPAARSAPRPRGRPAGSLAPQTSVSGCAGRALVLSEIAA